MEQRDPNMRLAVGHFFAGCLPGKEAYHSCAEWTILLSEHRRLAAEHAAELGHARSTIDPETARLVLETKARVSRWWIQ